MFFQRDFLDFSVLYSTLFHLPPLRFYCAVPVMLGSNPGQLRLRDWLSDTTTTRPDLILFVKLSRIFLLLMVSLPLLESLSNVHADFLTLSEFPADAGVSFVFGFTSVAGYSSFESIFDLAGVLKMYMASLLLLVLSISSLLLLLFLHTCCC